jgi:AbrB family looped-hinge helix DNA binding protein
MVTKLSSKGQIVLPSALRVKLALQEGEAFDISVQSNAKEERIILTRKTPRRKKARIVWDKTTGFPALKLPEGAPPMTTESVRQMLADFP